ncbi:hypothetical protein [Aquimarina sp. Aq78]|uniref:hypothetical protein n=1 Tax=Aquimarina sp. Aq78 TaxID=1191889 RepID=UPI00131A9BCA|nr:hypothetical protein [Aquimarina sp. Aq78]
MKQQIYILLILTLGIISCQDVDSLVNSIAQENRVECEAIGFGGSSSSLYKKFKKLKRNASKDELIKLTNHDSLAVIGYSSYALIDRKLIQPNKLLQRFIDNKDAVSTFCGCIMSSETLSSLIYHRYWNSRVEYPDNEDYEKFVINDSRDLQKMDSLILYSKKPDWILLSRAFENRIYSNNYKSKIEYWAFKKNDFYALEYVFKNLRTGNEEKIIESFDEYVANDENHQAQKEKILQMKNEMNNEY